MVNPSYTSAHAIVTLNLGMWNGTTCVTSNALPEANYIFIPKSSYALILDSDFLATNQVAMNFTCADRVIQVNDLIVHDVFQLFITGSNYSSSLPIISEVSVYAVP